MSTLDSLLLMVMAIHTLAIFGGVLLQRREPAGTLAWLLALVLLPGIGLLVYLAVGRPRARRWQQTHTQITAQVSAALTENLHVSLLAPSGTASNDPCLAHGARQD